MDQISLGICAWSVPAESHEKIPLSAEMGFSGLEIDFGRPDDGYIFRDEVYARAFREQADAYGIRVETMALNVLNHIGMVDEGNHDLIAGIFDDAVKTVDLLGIQCLQIPSFGNGIIQGEEDLMRTAVCIRTLCDKLGETVMVASENGLDVKDNLLLIDEVGRENFKIYFDTANPYLLGDRLDGPEVLKALLPYVGEVHMKDAILDDRGGFSYVPLGSGDVRLEESIILLKEYGYTGWIHIENIYEKERLIEDRIMLERAFNLDCGPE